MKDNVFFAIISSTELQRLHRILGDALFFENVRDFIEPSRNQEREGRTSVNAEIVKTIVESPGKLLERNNGIVFRASSVQLGADDHMLVLANGSIVNGCQTTMCIVEHAVQPCFVPIKIVQTQDSWDVAKAANYQNPVDVIDLDIARNLRPQLAKRAAAALGVRMGDSRKSAIQIIDVIYDQRVTYEETRLLYLGLFSRSPNNVFATNYTDLMQGLITRFSHDDPTGERVFGILFKLQHASSDGLRQAEGRFKNPEYVRLFQRFYKDQRPSYRCFVSILALCGAIGVNVADREKEEDAEYARMLEFFAKADRLFDGHRQRFLVMYRLAVKEWMREMIDAGADDNKVQQEMATRSKRADFRKLWTDLLVEADNDDTLAGLPFA